MLSKSTLYCHITGRSWPVNGDKWSHCTSGWIQNWITITERSNWRQIFDFLARVKFNGWHEQKTIESISHALRRYVYNLIAICEFILSNRPENLKFDPKRRFFSPCDLKIWEMPLKNNRAPLLCYFATSNFVNHFVAIGELEFEIVSGNAHFGSNVAIFLSCVTLESHRWPWKTMGYLFYVGTHKEQVVN